jgi:Putative Ig domain/PASTA domain
MTATHIHTIAYPPDRRLSHTPPRWNAPQRVVLLFCAAFLILLAHPFPASAAPPADATYTQIDYPGAAWTAVNGVNRSGTGGSSVEVVGTYDDIQGAHGFLLSGGHYTKLDVPGGGSTTAVAINARHEIVGTYTDPSSLETCNYKYSQGTYTPILSNCWFAPPESPVVSGINDADELVGSTCCHSSSHRVGFLRFKGYEFTYDFVGASQTEIRGVNNSLTHEMVGDYTGADHRQHGAMFDAHGDVWRPFSGTSFDVPGATSTIASGINDSGQIAGTYGDGHTTHGFIGNQRSYRAIDYPGAAGTTVNGINDVDDTGHVDVVGTYRGQGGQHGFLATVTPPSPPSPLTVGASNQSSTLGAPVNMVLPVTVSGGTPPYTVTMTGLPNGLTSSGSLISGTASAAGTFTVAVTATDSVGDVAMTSFTWTVTGVTVPNVLGETEPAAASLITGLGLAPSVSTQKACIDPAHVITQTPDAGAVVAPGASVRITVDSGTLATCVLK